MEEVLQAKINIFKSVEVEKDISSTSVAQSPPRVGDFCVFEVSSFCYNK